MNRPVRHAPVTCCMSHCMIKACIDMYLSVFMTTKVLILYMKLLKLCFSLLDDSITGQISNACYRFYSHMTATHMVIDAGMSGNRARELHNWLKCHKCSVVWPCNGKSSTIIWLVICASVSGKCLL